MTYKIFRDELNSLIHEISEGNRPQANVLAAYTSHVDVPNIVKKLEELLEDIVGFARSRLHDDLMSQLVLIQNSGESYNHRSSKGEIEAKARRIDRALRVYTDVLVSDPNPDEVKSRGKIDKESLADATKTKKVLVVHGHDVAVLHETCRLLSALNLTPIVLREQPNKGKTIIEKFESNSDVGFAIILMTADDMGGTLEASQSDQLTPRARQNVVMELGYFSAKLGRSRVAVLKSKDVEEPSDIFGVIYTEIDDHSAWRMTLSKELKAAGYAVDLNFI